MNLHIGGIRLREKFREFYFDKDDENIWKESIIVLDTNVLLNLYRYTKETSDQILGLLHKYRDNLWMPHQVALEYHYNRKSVIMEQNGSYKKVCSAFNAVPNKVKEMLNQNLSSYKKRHKEDVEEFIKVIKKVTEDQIKNLNENVVEYDLNKDDVIKTKITELYYNKVGEPYNEEQMKELEIDADKRLEMEIPPGYKDFNKKNGHKFYNGVIIQNKYGDLILWKQLLDFAKDKETSVIFLTDEQKEDWWYDVKSKTIGPKVELLNEFTSLTKKEFHMFSSLGFVERHMGEVNPNTVSEVREVAEDYVSKFESLNKQITDGTLYERINKQFKINFKENLEKTNFAEETRPKKHYVKPVSSFILEFSYWFKNNEMMFNETEEYFGRFHSHVESALGSYVADRIMKEFNRLDITEISPATKRMVVNMAKVREYVYEYIDN